MHALSTGNSDQVNDYRFNHKMTYLTSRNIARGWLIQDVAIVLLIVISTNYAYDLVRRRSIACNVHPGIAYDWGLMVGLLYGVGAGLTIGSGLVTRTCILHLPEVEHQD